MKNNHRDRLALNRIERDQPTTKVTSELLNEHVAKKPPLLAAVDRPGFDLGGSTGKTTAGTGIGLGDDAGENRIDRSLLGRHAKPILSKPRWLGPDADIDPPKKR
ncbi:MAG: hypothetical protein ABIN69_13635 [Aestuariivirga sp.]